MKYISILSLFFCMTAQADIPYPYQEDKMDVTVENGVTTVVLSGGPKGRVKQLVDLCEQAGLTKSEMITEDGPDRVRHQGLNISSEVVTFYGPWGKCGALGVGPCPALGDQRQARPQDIFTNYFVHLKVDSKSNISTQVRRGQVVVRGELFTEFQNILTRANFTDKHPAQPHCMSELNGHPIPPYCYLRLNY